MLGKLIYYRDKFDVGRSPKFAVSSSPFAVAAADGIPIAGWKLEGKGDVAFVVAHGFLAHSRAPGILEFSESLTRFGPVWSIDLRGHGSSGGASTLGAAEALDIAAALRLVRREVSLPVVVVGFSMGAAGAVRAAALHEPADAVVSISGPGVWFGPRGWAAHRTALLWRIPLADVALRILTGVRMRPSWEEAEPPVEVAKRIAPAALLVVHGTRDHFFPVEEAEALERAAEEPRDLWLVEGGGHAESLFSRPGHPVDRQRVDVFVDELMSRIEALIPWRE